MSAGMAYEAMNDAGALDARLIVVLNDNDMSIAPPAGAVGAYLAELVSGHAPIDRYAARRPSSSPSGSRSTSRGNRAAQRSKQAAS